MATETSVPTSDDVFNEVPATPAPAAPAPVPDPPAPAAPPATDPVPAQVDPAPAPVDPAPAPAPGKALSPLNDAGELRVLGDVFDVREVEKWDHDLIEFKGDTLGVIEPQTKALAGYSLSMTKFVPAQLRNDINSLFIVEHLSSSSYERVIARLISPHDEGYTEDTIGELMEVIVEKTVERLKAKEEADKAAAAAAKK